MTAPFTVDAAARRQLLPLLFVSVFMSALDTAIVGPALPALRSAFGVDQRAVGLVTTAYVIALLAATALFANLGDRHGRRPVFLWSVGIFAVGSLLVALSPGFWWIVASRVVQGIGAGGITPIASAIVGDVFPAEERGKALGLLGATFGLAFVVGPPVAALLLAAGGWPSLFLINLPVAAWVILRARRALPRVARAGPQRPLDVAGLALTCITLVLLTLGLTRLLDGVLGRTVWPAFLAVAGVAAGALAAVERRAAAPLLPPVLFRRGTLVLVYLVTIAAGFGMGAVNYLASLATLAYGMTPQAAGFWLLPLVTASMLGAAGGGVVMNRLGPRRLLATGFALLVVGYLGFTVSLSSQWAFAAASLPTGLGVGIVVGGALRSIAIDEAPAEQRTIAQGVINIATAVGTLTAMSAVGTIADFAGGGADGFARAYLVVGLLLVPAMAATLALPKGARA